MCNGDSLKCVISDLESVSVTVSISLAKVNGLSHEHKAVDLVFRTKVKCDPTK